ncbi:MAG: hypothetical protein GTO63_28720, partial [Anaerolineae bacterium]|nr:hypothetical protein [Anaerolineae bacterium]NIN98753.1 hypothetical protein [Anaerolineae bacterium]NIQ81638.1 hypothetical protein [Anaerolineae bacterium]
MTIDTATPNEQELRAFLASKLNRNLSMYFDTCQRCGLCAESCHYYAATQDPKMIPAYKAEQVRKLYGQSNGWVSRLVPWLGRGNGNGFDGASLDALSDVVFGSCTMC